MKTRLVFIASLLLAVFLTAGCGGGGVKTSPLEGKTYVFKLEDKDDSTFVLQLTGAYDEKGAFVGTMFDKVGRPFYYISAAPWAADPTKYYIQATPGIDYRGSTWEQFSLKVGYSGQDTDGSFIFEKNVRAKLWDDSPWHYFDVSAKPISP
jgi:hypothetical protein